MRILTNFSSEIMQTKRIEWNNVKCWKKKVTNWYFIFKKIMHPNEAEIFSWTNKTEGIQCYQTRPSPQEMLILLRWGWGYSLAVEHLPNMQKTLGSIMANLKIFKLLWWHYSPNWSTYLKQYLTHNSSWFPCRNWLANSKIHMDLE